MANWRERRVGELFEEWLARLRGSESENVPPVPTLTDVEPTVTEAAEEQAVQGRMPTGLLGEDFPGSGLQGGAYGTRDYDLERGGGYANLLDQHLNINPLGPFSDPFGDPKFFEMSGEFRDMSLQDKFDLVRRGGLQKGWMEGGVPEPGSEEYKSKPWLKSIVAEGLGIPADIVQAIGRGFDSSGIAGAIQEGWTGQPSDPGIGSSVEPISGGSDWWAQHFGLTPDKGQKYANWFSDKTRKQLGQFPYWPWKDSETPEEVEIKVDISKANPAWKKQTTVDKTDGKSQVSQRTGTPSIMENSRSNMMIQMLGTDALESMDMEKMFKKAEGDYNTAIVIGQLTGKGIGPANKFMSSFLQGAGLQYRMDKDKKDMAYSIMTARPKNYYFHDAAMGIPPISLLPWDDVPQGYTDQRPTLTRQQMDRKQYQEILDEYPNNREAGFDAAIDALIANEGPLFTAWDNKYYDEPQKARYAKERAAAIIVSGWFNPGGGVHLTREERKQFAEAWKAGKFEEIKRMIKDKNNGWPMDYDELVRAMFGS